MPVLNGLLPSGRTKTRLRLAACYCLIPFLLSAFVAPSISWGQTSSADTEVELEFWRAVKDSDDPDMYQAYLTTFPEGTFVPLVKIKLKGLEKALVKGQERTKEAEPKGLVAEIARWTAIKDSDDRDMFRAYLEEFPGGRFVSLAKIQLSKLQAPAQTQLSEELTPPKVKDENSSEDLPASKETVTLKKKAGDSCPDGKIQTFKGCVDIVKAEADQTQAQANAESRAQAEALAVVQSAMQAAVVKNKATAKTAPKEKSTSKSPGKRNNAESTAGAGQQRYNSGSLANDYPKGWVTGGRWTGPPALADYWNRLNSR